MSARDRSPRRTPSISGTWSSSTSSTAIAGCLAAKAANNSPMTKGAGAARQPIRSERPGWRRRSRRATTQRSQRRRAAVGTIGVDQRRARLVEGDIDELADEDASACRAVDAAPSWQSKATSASSRTGAPLLSARQATPSNLSPEGVFVRPANVSEMTAWSSRSTFTQNTPFSRIIPAAALCWLTQTSSEGAEPSAETDVMALTVTPARPAAPAVVTTDTVHAARLMPSRNASRSMAVAAAYASPPLGPQKITQVAKSLLKSVNACSAPASTKMASPGLNARLLSALGERAGAADHDIELVLIVRVLSVLARRRIDAGPHGAMLERIEGLLAFGC